METYPVPDTSNIKFLADNFAMFGFGDPDAALLQSFKELIENSIDACQDCPLPKSTCLTILGSDVTGSAKSHSAFQVPTPHLISVNLRAGSSNLNLANSGEMCILEVQDTGCGMDDTTKLLKCFQSTKVSSVTTGRFGVGLSACLLYTIVNSQQCMHVRTKSTASGDMVVSSMIGLSALDCVPVALREVRLRAVDFPRGTLIQLHLPLPVPLPVAALPPLRTQQGDKDFICAVMP